MWSVALKKLNAQRVSSGLSYAAIANATGYAQSSVHRWYSGESIPDMEQTENIYTATGGNVRDLYADVGASEMEAAQKIDYKGTDILLAEFEKREALMRHHTEQVVQHQIELRTQQQAAFEKSLDALNAAHQETLTEMRRHYNVSVSHLKTQVKNLRTALIAMLVLFVLAVITIVLIAAIDAPHIGAGGSVFTAKSPHAFWLWLLGILSAALAVAFVLLLARRKVPASLPVSPQDSQ